eukprot:13369683-Alexandrium_andersonii.AAC.1
MPKSGSLRGSRPASTVSSLPLGSLPVIWPRRPLRSVLSTLACARSGSASVLKPGAVGWRGPTGP